MTMQRRVGIRCDNIAGDGNVQSIEPDRQGTKRSLPRRRAVVNEHASIQYSEALDDHSNVPDEKSLQRRPGTYCESISTDAHTERGELNKTPSERYIQRRHAIVNKNKADQYPDGSDDESKAIVDPSDDEIYLLSKESENRANAQSHTVGKIKKQYIKPSPVDVIMEGSLCDGNIGIKGYVAALYADRYKEAVRESQRNVIACAVLGSIEGRGGRYLKESTSKDGMYYEVDELYAMKRVKEALQNSDISRNDVACTQEGSSS